MRFEWDPKKATANAAKHGLTFELAITAFDDPFALVALDVPHSMSKEERWWLIGEADTGGAVVVVLFVGSSVRDLQTGRNDGDMAKANDFPFERARRVTPREVEAARKAIEAKLRTKRPRRWRPPKRVTEKYRPVSIRLHPKVIDWAKKEARRRGVGYQTVINEVLLRMTG